MTSKAKDAPLPVVTEENYLFLDPNLDIAGLIEENLAGEKLDRFTLTNVHVPTGGGTTWTVPGLRGEEDTKELVGVIVALNREKVYWKQAFGAETGSPPDCKAPDAIFGMGDPGGECLRCPNNQFGTKLLPGGGLGKGKACRDQVVLLFMRGASRMPICITVPPSSLQEFKTFRANLVNEGYSRAEAVTKIALVKATNSGGIAYAEMQFELVGTIKKDLVPTVRKFTALFEPPMKGALPAPPAPQQIEH